MFQTNFLYFNKIILWAAKCVKIFDMYDSAFNTFTVSHTRNTVEKGRLMQIFADTSWKIILTLIRLKEQSVRVLKTVFYRILQNTKYGDKVRMTLKLLPCRKDILTILEYRLQE